MFIDALDRHRAMRPTSFARAPSRGGKMEGQAVKATLPALLVRLADGLARDFDVDDGDLGTFLARLDSDRHERRFAPTLLDVPGVDELRWGFDLAKLPLDRQGRAPGKQVDDAVAPTDAQVHL